MRGLVVRTQFTPLDCILVDVCSVKAIRRAERSQRSEHDRGQRDRVMSGGLMERLLLQGCRVGGILRAMRGEELPLLPLKIPRRKAKGVDQGREPASQLIQSLR